MSRRNITSRVDDPTKEGVQKLQRDRGYEHQSDAARVALRTGLSELGYLSEGAGLTPARKLARYVTQMLLHVSLVLLFLSAVTPMAFTVPGVGVAFGAIGMFAVDHWVLRAVEPAVTNRLPIPEVTFR